MPISSPLRLDKALTKGVLSTFVMNIAPGNVKSPAKNHVWLILFGYISHITGTNSTICVRDKEGGVTEATWRSIVPSAQGTGGVSLFNNEPDAMQSSPSFVIVTDRDEIHVMGGTNFFYRLTVLEWTIN